jgi:homoserine kinase type II
MTNLNSLRAKPFAASRSSAPITGLRHNVTSENFNIATFCLFYMELVELIESLPLGRLKSVQRYKQGLHNDTYHMKTSKGEFSLRVYNYKKPSQILFELAILEKLKGMKVPQLVRLNKGFIEKFNGKYVILYKYLPGDHLQQFSHEQLRDVGRFIGEYHQKCENFSWSKYRYQFYNLPDWKIKKFEQISRKAKLKYLDKLPAIIKDLKASRLSRSLPRGPIHVDIKPENVLFHKGKLSGVLDFDNAFIGPFILDLAKSIVWFGTRNKQFHVREALQIYRGYVEKRKLTKDEYSALYDAIKFAFLSHVFVDYQMRAIGATTQEYFEFIVNDLYKSYLTFQMSKKEFYQLL